MKLALTSFHARVLLVDNINPAATTHYTAVFIAHFGRLQAVSDFHGPFSPPMLMDVQNKLARHIPGACVRVNISRSFGRIFL
ncbi:hypothetical protein BJI49_04435 [Acetobacter pasteurianus]|nr:hypothetical protein BJI49_04435 [Acetobacter pasteurianus]